MIVKSSRPLALGVSAALASAGLLLALPTSAGATTPTSPSFLGYAYGTNATVVPVSSGPTAKLSVCSGVPGATYGNNIAKVDLGTGVGRVGAVTTSMQTTKTTDVVTAKTLDTNLLGGLVQASAVTSTSTSTLGSDGKVSTSGSSVISGLRVLGLPRTVSAGTNSKIDIPGVATVTINGQSGYQKNGLTQLSVTALRVDLLKGNKLGLPAGAIIVGNAVSGIHTPTVFRAGGQAYATQVDLAGVVSSGATALVNLSCGGSNGYTETNSTAAVNVPGLVVTRAASSTARSVDTADGTTAQLQSKIAGVNLLNGVVKVDAITAKSTSTRVGSTLTSTSAGTEITGLTVNGNQVQIDAAENSKIDIAGVGTLTLRKTVKYSTGQDVIGLELKLSTDQLGLKAGTVIQVAAAKSRVATN